MPARPGHGRGLEALRQALTHPAERPARRRPDADQPGRGADGDEAAGARRSQAADAMGCLDHVRIDMQDRRGRARCASWR
ncbi:MAG: hypothetical protein M0C28_06415 [Candidatus Moduliflexus flocculans]|nr:hypothetical protein [Candidatus Moduliflexus flocculans]